MYQAVFDAENVKLHDHEHGAQRDPMVNWKDKPDEQQWNIDTELAAWLPALVGHMCILGSFWVCGGLVEE